MGDLADPTVLDSSPADGPETETSGIEKMIQEAVQSALAQANAATETRIKGFQTLLNQRDADLRGLNEQLEQARLASLDDDERAAEIERKEQAELDRLRAENELLRLGPEYSKELPLFQRLLAAPDAKSQLDLIRELMTPSAPANEPEGKVVIDPAPVDPNNPASTSPGGGVYDGTTMSDELAERLLRSTSRMR